MHVFRSLINSQIKICNKFDLLLPAKFRIDGYRDFSRSIIPKYLQEKSIIYDIGGGKNPYITAEMKATRNCSITGIDIDKNELNLAPEGIYNRAVASDITKYEGNGDGDLVICLALLEHVENVESAMKGIASCLKINGKACLFVPSKNALFARINTMLPEGFKKQILYSIFPGTRKLHGFPAYYDRCTPHEIKQIARSMGFVVLEEKYYYKSTYFSFFFPLYLLWRLHLYLFNLIAGDEAAETFGLVLRKSN
ncbi:Methyltransferase domain protein [uncultured archaeon]|nr:Methyltransferase domain protein [uncultured archaeon]